MHEEDVSPQPRPHALTVLVLLVLAALTLSYLAAYALPDALVASQIMPPWPHETDPRPHWMLAGFVSLFGTLSAISCVIRFLSWRQLRCIDAIADEGTGSK
ncbi:MAG: hypothetical protein JWO87_2119 [Phycisphaerales bacterium]|jgi:hypothetical protein|nr:hypothetical protein [Phycisphaerales bacterium]MDB5300456.1 hypothetical protein [Phycisphaerales bacterium]MDB5305350.1 hypothetical protein [Phycisphaerales bacterium]